MAKKPEPTATPSWRIFRIRGTAQVYLGIVNAPDEASAIKKAIVEFQITHPEEQKRLVAERRA